MRKILLFILSAFFSAAGMAQSVPNGGFENWIVTSYENPLNYQSSNQEEKNGQTNVVNAIKTNDAYHGSYAIQLTTVAANNDTLFAYFANGNPGSNPPTGGVPISQKPNGLRVYYKSNINTGDTALILLYFKKLGTTIGTYLYKIGATHATYTLFNPTFSPALPVTPDTVIFAAASSNAFANFGIPGNMLQLDSLSFTGITSQPAMLNGDFESWQTLSSYKLNGWSLGGGYQRTTDVYSGSYALELQTSAPGFGDNSPRMGSAVDGISAPGTTKGGYPFPNQVDTLFLYYKYLPADPTDSAAVYLNFKKNGVFNYGVNKYLGLSAVYKLAKIPINAPSQPDSLLIFLNSSRTYPTPANYIGSDFKIDNMYLKSQMLPVSSFTLPSGGCVGQAVQLTDNSANMANSWNWIMAGGSPSSSISQNPVVTYSSVGTKTITMIATNQFGSGTPVSHTITIYSIPSVIATNTTICGGNSATITASGATTYSWNTGSTAASISASPTVTTVYTVTGTSNGCSNTTTGSINVLVPQTPNICLVSSDSASTYNYIYWNKTAYQHVDSFIIYREVTSGVYHRIGGQKYSALSQFKDSLQSIGPANGDPNVGTYRYKIQIKDSCGNVGAMSPYHNSIYFVNNAGSFTWNTYDVEGASITPVTQFNLLRDNLGTGTWTVVGTVAGTQNVLNDPQYNTYQSTGKWRVEALGFNCSPTAKVSQVYAKSKSNVKNNLGTATGISESQLSGSMKVSPNPATDVVKIESPVAIRKVSVYNVMGELVYQETSAADYGMVIRTGSFAPGVYTLIIEASGTRVSRKIVKE
ncbi:MAG: T9SS type A sorting domain-containing protein [Bacteroidetes bacterium]|nr:T9SS type A sorting domain-containing protein [Bacteroidota bacterium]